MVPFDLIILHIMTETLLERLDAHELDDILTEGRGEEYLGSIIEHDVFGSGTLLKVKKRDRDSHVYAVEWITDCPTDDCGNTFTFRTMSGCHHGAFCYVINEHGDYKCDLRNSYLTCGVCVNIPDKVVRIVNGIGKNIGVNI